MQLNCIPNIRRMKSKSKYRKWLLKSEYSVRTIQFWILSISSMLNINWFLTILSINRKQQREIEIKEATKRRQQAQRKAIVKNSPIYRVIPHMIWSRRTALATTAFSIVIGICAYYYKTQFISMTSGVSWNSINYMAVLFNRYGHIANRTPSIVY